MTGAAALATEGTDFLRARRSEESMTASLPMRDGGRFPNRRRSPEPVVGRPHDVVRMVARIEAYRSNSGERVQEKSVDFVFRLSKCVYKCFIVIGLHGRRHVPAQSRFARS